MLEPVPARAPSGRIFLVALGVAAVCGAALVTWQLTRGRGEAAGSVAQEPPASTSPAPMPVAKASFVLTIESTPAAAEVTEGDHVLGTTPITLPVAHASVAGAHRLFVVKREGYLPFTLRQTDSDENVRIVATLQPDPPPLATTASVAATASATASEKPRVFYTPPAVTAKPRPVPSIALTR